MLSGSLTMNPDLYKYSDYRQFLNQSISKKRGMKAALARKLRCQTSFVSQVLSGRTELSMDHAVIVCEFLGMTRAESRFYLLLVQRSRAGSIELKRFLDSEIEEERKKQKTIREKIKVYDRLSPNLETVYYSSWWYSAIHILVAFEEFQTRASIVDRLNLAPHVVDEALAFLESSKCIRNEKGKFKINQTRIHLDEKSPLIARHHSNWRIKAIEAIERQDPSHIHYSGVIGISRLAAEKIKTTLYETLQKVEPEIQNSPEEEPRVLLLDFFSL